MANILVDPVLVIAPSGNATKQEIEEWIDQLEKWLDEAKTTPHIWTHSITATCQLQYQGLFPIANILKNWQSKYELDINPFGLARKVNNFFNNEDLALEELLKKLEILVVPDEGSITIEPQKFSQRWPEFVRDEMYLLLATLAGCKQASLALAEDLSIATLALAEREIKVAATILDALPDFERSEDNRIAQNFSLIFAPEDLPLPVQDFWPDLQKCVQYHFQTNSAMQNYQGVRKEPLPFETTETFVKSVEHYCNKDKQLQAALTQALTKKLFGILDEGLDDKILRGQAEIKQFRVTRFWRVHYKQTDDRVILQEFMPHP